MFDAHQRVVDPLGDGHHVVGDEGANVCRTGKTRSDPFSLIALETNGDGIVHPLDVTLDMAKFRPVLGGGDAVVFGD